MSTLKDIAARVGVSQGCVSRVLKGDPTFSIQEATRFKIDVYKRQTMVRAPYFSLSLMYKRQKGSPSTCTSSSASSMLVESSPRVSP